MLCERGRRVVVMKVRDAKAKDIIQIECAGSYDFGSPFYLITTLQDNTQAVRAYKSLGGGITYLYPDNNCRVITDKQLFSEVYK